MAPRYTSIRASRGGAGRAGIERWDMPSSAVTLAERLPELLEGHHGLVPGAPVLLDPLPAVRQEQMPALRALPRQFETDLLLATPAHHRTSDAKKPPLATGIATGASSASNSFCSRIGSILMAFRGAPKGFVLPTGEYVNEFKGSAIPTVDNYLSLPLRPTT